MEVEFDDVEVVLEEWVKQNKTTVQSVICSKTRFKSAEAARKWVSDHNFKTNKTDETEDSYRFRQFTPGLCREGSFRTISLSRGVKAVICKKKESNGASMEPVEAFNLSELRKYYLGQNPELVRVIDFADGTWGIEKFHSSIVKDDDGRSEIVHFISTPRIDPVKDVMDPFGIEAEALEKNRGVFYNHQWYGARDLPIGKMVWLKSEKNGVLAKTRYAVEEYEFAADIYRLVKSGFLNSYSIGYRVKSIKQLTVAALKEEVGERFNIANLADFSDTDTVWLNSQWSCHEYSQVGIPMNMDALRRGLSTEGIVKSSLGREYFGSVCGREKLGDITGAVQEVVKNCASGLVEEIALLKDQVGRIVKWIDFPIDIGEPTSSIELDDNEVHAEAETSGEAKTLEAFNTKALIESIVAGEVSRARGIVK